MATKIIGIHGAYSSPKCFGYFIDKLNDYEWIFLDYSDITTDLGAVYKRAHDFMSKLNPDDSYHIIAHSLGGLVSLEISDYPFIKSITTIGSPIGGSIYSFFDYFISYSSFLYDINVYSTYIANLKKKNYTGKKIQHIITSNGYNPYMFQTLNDGVISVYSQKSWTPGAQIVVPINHFEIMVSKEAVDIIKPFIDIND